MRIADWAAAIISLGPVLAAQDDARQRPEYKAVLQKIEQIRKSKKPSLSIGKPNDARLVNACKLPVQGVGYRLANPGRKTNFGTDEMVFGLMEMGVLLYLKYGEQGTFVIGDISAEHGGRLRPHSSHQGGRDVDLGFFVTDAHGRPQGNQYCAGDFDKEGKIKGGTLRFDVERNWEFVCLMLENRFFGGVQYIFVAEWLKKRLLDYARTNLSKIRSPVEYARQKKCLDLAEQVLQHEPGHENHFHLRIKCAPEDSKEG